MNELIDKFCVSRRRGLIVIGGTFVLALVTLLPLADHYCALCDENNELGGQLKEVQRVASDLAGFETRVEEKRQELEEADQRTVSEEAVSAYRNKLISFARESGCQVRRISFATARTRPWFKDDNVMAPATSKTDNRKTTPYIVETRPVTLSVAGPMTSVNKLLSRVQDDQTMHHVKHFELRPTGKNRRSVQLELELWCYSLAKANT